MDAGFRQGDVIGGNFDSLLAKLIVTGRDRQEALERSRRALDEFNVEGIATAITFDRVVVRDPAFAPEDPDEHMTIYTTWIETGFDNQIPAYVAETADTAEPQERETVVVEVAGKRLEVSLPAGLGGLSTGGKSGGAKAPKRKSKKAIGGAGGNAVVAPMQGTIVKVAVEEGQEVEEGELVIVLEAMKMEQPINAPKSGTVSNMAAEVGATVSNGAPLLEIDD